MTIEIFRLMADYNLWMNDKVYAAAETLSADAFERDRGAFFGSIAGTLEHLLGVDVLWLKRFRKTALGAGLGAIEAIAAPTEPDVRMFPTLAAMRECRIVLDRLIIDWIGGLAATDLGGPLAYRRMNGDRHVKPAVPVLMHFFNHQTHHRGQVTTLLTQAGVDVGVTDLVAMVADL
jgi:uncharacterized damage-inducible protein DinB